MKRTLKKLLICILIALIINNFLITNMSFAFGDWLADMLGSVVGLLTWPVRIVALACGNAVDKLAGAVAYCQGSVDANGNIDPGTFFNDELITPFDIFFNKIALLDVNFFNIPNDDTVIANIRKSIAGWYYAMRNIAAMILLCVFIYVGIRMAITTIASDKAAYKKMLVDWICSLALIFLLHYIIIFTFSVNETFIKALSNVGDAKSLSDAMVEIRDTATGASVNAIAATIVYCMLIAQTLGLIISYLNRMLKLAFLIIIAPLITLTYSIDKMGDGKAQALGTWLKEFVYTVLLQTFHCIIYMAFISMALAIFTDTAASEKNNLAGAILAMLCVKFTKDAEKILGKIFKFSDATSDSSLAVGMAASAMALSKAKGMGKGARSLVNGASNLKGNVGKFMQNAKIETQTAKNLMSGMSVADAKAAATATVIAASAAKAEKRNAKKYGVISDVSEEEAKEFDEYDKADATKKAEMEADWKKKDPNKMARYNYQSALKQETAANMQKGMKAGEAAARARASMAERTRYSERGKNKVISGYRKAKQYVKQNEVLKDMGKLAQATVSAGIGTFVGGATYGASGNAFTAIASGAAVHKGMQEFMKSSTKTMANSVAELMAGAGCKSEEDLQRKTQDIVGRQDQFEDFEERIKDLVDQVNDKLKAANINVDKKDLQSRITNSVSSQISQNPSATNESIIQGLMQDNGMKTLLSKNGVDAGAFEAAIKEDGAIGDVIDFTRDKQIYDQIKQAGDLGIGPDAFEREYSKQFRDNMASHSGGKDALDTSLATDALAQGSTVDAAEIRERCKEAEDGVDKYTRDEIEKSRKMVAEQVSSMEATQVAAAQAGVQMDKEFEDKLKRLTAVRDELEYQRNLLDQKAAKLERQSISSQRTGTLSESLTAQLDARERKLDSMERKLQSRIEAYKQRTNNNNS